MGDKVCCAHCQLDSSVSLFYPCVHWIGSVGPHTKGSRSLKDRERPKPPPAKPPLRKLKRRGWPFLSLSLVESSRLERSQSCGSFVRDVCGVPTAVLFVAPCPRPVPPALSPPSHPRVLWRAGTAAGLPYPGSRRRKTPGGKSTQ